MSRLSTVIFSACNHTYNHQKDDECTNSSTTCTLKHAISTYCQMDTALMSH